MVGHKTTIILFLVCIQIYLSIQAVIQPADILGDDSQANKRHNQIDKVNNNVLTLENYLMFKLSVILEMSKSTSNHAYVSMLWNRNFFC